MRGRDMKKYVKPELFYERYELSQHIADCAWELKNHSTTEACKAQADTDYLPFSPEETLFTNSIGCFYDKSNYEDYCEQNGMKGVNVFIS